MPNNHVNITGENVRMLYENVPQLIFEVTEDCNFKCKYCAYGDNYIQPEWRPLNSRRYMSWETARILMDEFLSIWSNQVCDTVNVRISFYGGEPLLNFPLIERIVSYLTVNKPEHIKYIYNLTSNGFFLNKHLPYLKEHDFRVAVSLDGDILANKYRVFGSGKETFSIVKRNLDYIYETSPDFFRNNISFLSVLNNHSSVLDVLSFFSENYQTTTEISPISRDYLCTDSRIDEYYRDYDSSLEEDFLYKRSEWEKLRLASPREGKVKSCFMKISSGYYFTYLDFFNEDKKRKRRDIISETCPPFKCRLFLTVDGYIYPCEKVYMSSPLGRIYHGKIEIDFEEIANRYSTMYNTANRFCLSCINQMDCPHCFLKDGGLFDDGVRFCSDYKQISEKSLRDCIKYIEENVEDFKSLF